jgi:hypothetical protein
VRNQLGLDFAAVVPDPPKPVEPTKPVELCCYCHQPLTEDDFAQKFGEHSECFDKEMMEDDAKQESSRPPL